MYTIEGDWNPLKWDEFWIANTEERLFFAKVQRNYYSEDYGGKSLKTEGALRLW